MQWKEKRTAVQKQAGLFSAGGSLGDCRVRGLQVSQAFLLQPAYLQVGINCLPYLTRYLWRRKSDYMCECVLKKLLKRQHGTFCIFCRQGNIKESALHPDLRVIQTTMAWRFHLANLSQLAGKPPFSKMLWQAEEGPSQRCPHPPPWNL